MTSKNRLATLVGMAALAGIVPAMAEEHTKTAETNQVQNTGTSFTQKTWGYTGKVFGSGISYLGQGVSLIGDGISWTLDKTMIPIRKTGEVAKEVGDTLAKGPEFVEDKTGIPMQTMASVLRWPGYTLFSLTDNSGDFFKDAPKASLGMVGSTFDLMGQSICADTDGIAKAGKDFAGHGVDFGFTIVGDATPIGLQAVGFIFGTAGIPHDAIVRDGLAGAHRTTDLLTGQADLSKPIPKDIFGAGKYTYDRITSGKEMADMKGGKFFASAETSSEVKATKVLSPETLKKLHDDQQVRGG